MTDFQDYLEESLKDSVFKEEYDALEPAFSLIEAIMKARAETGLTQMQLSERTGISQADISRIERGTANPSLKTMKRIAVAFGKRLQVKFV